jgi:maleate isomerase
MGRGIVGVLTPQANPTVEPELAQLLAGEALMLTTRMCSTAPTMPDRLLDYAEQVESWIASFGGMAIDVFAFACTGSFYLMGPAGEQALCDRLAARGVRLVTATMAIRQALAACGATRVTLVNPYPPAILEAALGYWRACGLDIVEIVDVEQAREQHPIYGIRDEAVAASLQRAVAVSADAVLLSGTGMRSLGALARVQHEKPLLSSNLCLAWASLNVLGAGLDPVRWATQATRR